MNARQDAFCNGRPSRKDAAKAMLPLRFRGKNLMLVVRTVQDENSEDVEVVLDVEDWTESAFSRDGKETSGLPDSKFLTSLRINLERITLDPR